MTGNHSGWINDTLIVATINMDRMNLKWLEANSVEPIGYANVPKNKAVCVEYLSQNDEYRLLSMKSMKQCRSH
jgi:hypothetical protein